MSKFVLRHHEKWFFEILLGVLAITPSCSFKNNCPTRQFLFLYFGNFITALQLSISENTEIALA